MHGIRPQRFKEYASFNGRHARPRLERAARLGISNPVELGRKRHNEHNEDILVAIPSTVHPSLALGNGFVSHPESRDGETWSRNHYGQRQCTLDP